MIIGLGCDIINIERVARLIDKSGNNFLQRTFTVDEIASARKYSNKQKYYAHFAKRFAAKEAFAKAIGTGFGRSLSFTDISIINNHYGKPVIIINERASTLAKSLANGKEILCHISLSDDHPFAQAVAIIESIQ
jgi:holo-[acyl-carrier protein] synthase